MRLKDQALRDSDRKTYTLTFPSTLDAPRVLAWLRSISGTLKSGPSRLMGVPTIAFELWATDRGITHRLKVPWQHADYVIGQLRSLVPGIRVTPDEEIPHAIWTTAVEVGMSNPSRNLRITTPEDVSASLLASVQALKPGETVIMQWIVTPAVPERPPISPSKSNEFSWWSWFTTPSASSDEVNDRRAKLSEPNLLAVLRIGALAETEIRADHLIYRLRAALAAVRTPYNHFTKRRVGAEKLQARLDTAAGVLTFPMQLSASELTALLAWPIGSPFVAGLPQGLARHLPATEAIARDGLRIGRSNFPGNERPVAIAHLDALKHIHVIGPTGVGKTTLLANMLEQSVAQGYGLVLIESKGDLFHQALDYIHRERIKDVIVLDVNDAAMPVGFNIMGEGNKRAVVDEITQLFSHLYSDARGVWTREVLYHGLHTLQTRDGLTFVDLAPLLSPMTDEESAWRDDLIRSLQDGELRNFWQRFENQPRAAQDRITQPVMDRIWQLNARPEIRNIIGQSQSSFTMTDVVRDSKVLLINLSGVGQETASLAGTLLMSALWRAVKTTRLEKPTYLYLDEFQDFLNLPIGAEDMLAKSRSFGLGMVLAHQHLGQLPTDVRGAVLANARSKVVFQTTADDARVMAREFGTNVEEHDFMHLGRYEAVARIATGDGVSAPITLTTSAPHPRLGYAGAVRDASRRAHGRSAASVEAEIKRRRTLDGARKKPRPRIGGMFD